MQFNYSARTKDGQMQSGKVDAPSEGAAVEILHQNNLVVVEVRPVGGAFFGKSIQFLQRVKSKELVAFSRQLAILFSAKVSLVESLSTLSHQTTNLYFRDVILDVAHEVEAGGFLSRALAKHPKVFNAFFVNLIKSGEASGNLENALNYLADYIERRYYLVSQVKGAMIYPAVIFVFFIVAVVVFLFWIFPTIGGMLKESGQELPLPTKIILWVSNAFTNWWFLILLFLIGGITSVVLFIKTERGRYALDKFKLRVPIFNKVFRNIYLAHFTENLSTLIKGGVPILAALKICSDLVGNVVFGGIINKAREGVRVGEPMHMVFAREIDIPPMVTQMIASGEQTGQLDMVLAKLASFYAREVESLVNNLSKLIEPLLIVTLAVGVGILVASVLLPIYNIVGGMS